MFSCSNIPIFCLLYFSSFASSFAQFLTSSFFVLHLLGAGKKNCLFLFFICISLRKKSSNFSVSFSSTQLFSSGFVMCSWVFLLLSVPPGVVILSYSFTPKELHICARRRRRIELLVYLIPLDFFLSTSFTKHRKKK